MEDHIHLAVSVPPKIAAAAFIGEVKGNSSHFVNQIIEPDFGFFGNRNTVYCRLAREIYRILSIN